MDTTFTDQQTKIVAAWLNDVNVAVYRALGTAGVAPATAADVVTNLKAEIISQLAISAYIQTLLPAASAAVARGTLGSTTVGDAVFIAANAGAAQDAIGGTATGKALLTAASVAAALSTLGARAKLQVFTVNGTYTPTTGMTACLAILIGGGGAGGGAPLTAGGQVSLGGGGGSGALVLSMLTAAQVGASQSVTIGAGGTGVSGASGGDGTYTTLGAGPLVRASGGGGGLFQGPFALTQTCAGGIGAFGATSVGDVKAGNRPGFPSWADSNGTPTGMYGLIGNGASSFLGGGGMSGEGSSSAPGYGGGGHGSVNPPSTAATTGQDGGVGIMLILEFF